MKGPGLADLDLSYRWLFAALVLLLSSGCVGAPATPIATASVLAPTAPPAITTAPVQRAEPFHRRGRSIRPLELHAAIQRQLVLPDGQLALLGTLTSAEREPVELVTLMLGAVGPDGGPMMRAELRSGPSRLAPGEAAPFMAVTRADADQLHWRAYAGGAPVTATGPGPLELIAEPELRTTPQGAPFVLGELRNAGAEPQRALLLLSLWEGERLRSVVSLRSPIPLEPGVRLGFTASDFPGGSSLAEAATLELRVRLEAAPGTDIVVPLAVQVEVFHTVGSALFVRGSVTNSTQAPLDSAVVLAEIRQLDGALFTAGWTVLPTPLEPNQQRDFVLELPLDQPLDLTTVELDLRAYGTRAGQ